MTEMLARVSARRPLAVIALWLAAMVAAGLVAGALLESALTTEFRLNSSFESARAKSLLEDRLRGPAPVSEIVIVQSDSLTVDDPEFRQKAEAVYADIAALGPDIAIPLPNYYQSGDPTLVSPKGRMTTIMPFVMAGDLKEATINVAKVLHVVEEANGRDGFRVLMVGDASTAHDNNELSETDLRRGERIGIPIAMIILVVLFGTLVAALAPIGFVHSLHHHSVWHSGSHRPGL